MRVMLMAFAGVAEEKRDKFLEKHAHVHAQTGNRIEYRIPIERYPDFAALARECDKAAAAEESIPRSFLVTLVSQYDAFLGRLIRAMYVLRPEWLNASERVLSFAELQELGSMDVAREFIIEKEVETVLRKSHAEQFAWFENKLGTTLRKDLDAWPTFIELTERRNLFVHCGGRVSSQYLSVCEKNRVGLKQRPAVGDMLGISLVYLHAAYECLFEIGAKLAQVAWRKIRPDQVREAGDSLIKTSYSLLLDEEYDLATRILDFAANPAMKYADDEGRRRVVINRAQAYKWSGDDQACRSILEREDWTACQDVFQLAVAVLRDDFAAADRIMRSLGKGGRVSERDYREWPLFREWRKRKSFATAYQDVFGREFSVVEQAERLGSKEGLVKLDEMLASKRKR
ncbi:MAG: hypothetical protein R3F05_01840 [Planctomycetota bacterium]